MTYDDDFIRLVMPDGRVRSLPCVALGMSWPPPEELRDETHGVFERVRMSEITDEQRAGMTHVMRGAEYRLKPPAITLH